MSKGIARCHHNITSFDQIDSVKLVYVWLPSSKKNPKQWWNVNIFIVDSFGSFAADQLMSYFNFLDIW